MTDEIKKSLQQSVKLLRLNGGINNKEFKPLIMSIERAIKQRRPQARIKQA